MHAEDFNAESWVVNRITQETLPFMLADLGYDVWLGNNRGAADYSSHEKFTVDDIEYWDFTFVDMGLFDVSAMLSYITIETGLEKVSYFGFSRGNQQLLYSLATNGDYIAPKIDKFIALAPCPFRGVSNVKSYDGFFSTLSDFEIFVIYGNKWESEFHKMC